MGPFRNVRGTFCVCWEVLYSCTDVGSLSFLGDLHTCRNEAGCQQHVNSSMFVLRRYCLTKHIHRMFPWISVKRLKKFWLEGKALVHFSPCHSETPVMWCSFSYLRRLIMTSFRWGNQCNDRSRVKFLKNRLKVIKRSPMTS